jgi:hypothetical protein
MATSSEEQAIVYLLTVCFILRRHTLPRWLHLLCAGQLVYYYFSKPIHLFSIFDRV